MVRKSVSEKPKIQWCSEGERLDCFNAVIVLAKRGIISLSVYHETMEAIMDRPVWTHELGITGLKNLRDELLGYPSKHPMEVLQEIRGPSSG